MKRAGMWFIAVTAVVIAPLSAGKPDVKLDRGKEVIVNLECCYDNDAIQVSIDGKPVFSDRVTTVPTIGIAKHLILHPNDEKFLISVRASGNGAKFQQVVDLRRGSFVGIQYDGKTGKFSIHQSMTRFLYD